MGNGASVFWSGLLGGLTGVFGLDNIGLLKNKRKINSKTAFFKRFNSKYMKKTQKIWLGIFLAMFIVPEVIWGALFSAVASIFSISFHPIITDTQVFTDHPSLAHLIILVELVGISGLLFLNTKKNKSNKYWKYIITTILVIILATLLFLLYLNYAISNISFP